MTATAGRPITHDAALELAAAALDFALSPDRRAALEAHLVRCASCDGTGAALAADAVAVRRLTSVGSPSARPLLAVIAAADSRPPRRTERGWTIVAAAAILLALGAGAVLGGALGAIRRPLGLEPLGIVWTRVAGPGALDADVPGSRVTTLATLRLPGSAVVAAGSRAGDAAIWIQGDDLRWLRVTDRELGRGRIEALATSGGRIVAVGSSVDPRGMPVGRIWESRDARSWLAVEVETMRTVTAVAATPSLVIAAGVPRSADAAPVWLSVEGGPWRAWDPGTLSGATVTGLAAGGPGFVAVGYDDRGGRAWVSLDGRSWTAAPSSQFQRGRLVGLASTPAGLVAVGWTTDASEHATPTAWASSDGETWARIPVDGTVHDGRLQAVAASSYGILAVGGTMDGPAAWRSEDGRTWQRVDTAMAWDVPALAAVGAFGERVLVAGTGAEGPAIWSGRRP